MEKDDLFSGAFTDQRFSALQFYSYGIVAAVKDLDSHDVEVYPLEAMPFVSGDITDIAVPVESETTDASGQTKHTTVNTSVSVKAKWLPIGCPNRLTSPDVRNGEMVVLLRLSTSDQYFWVTSEIGVKFRRLETIVLAISATKDETAQPGPNNTYWLEWSSHRKLLRIHTSKANDEACAFDIQLDCAAGNYSIQDDQGGCWQFDAPSQKQEYENASGSKATIQGKNMKYVIPGNIDFTCASYTVTTDSYTLKVSGAYSLSASSAKLNAPVSMPKGVAGNLGIAGSLNASGEVHGTNI